MGMSNTQSQAIAYLGPFGGGFGFSIAGVDVRECAHGDDMVKTLKSLVAAKEHNIIFVDETLAENELDVIAKLNQEPLPAIILLPNPASTQHVAATNLQQLMVRAIGSDIFEN